MAKKNLLKPTALDLFCGCGGLTVGLKRAGFQVIGAVDIDPLSMKTFAANHPEVHRWRRNIMYLSPRNVMRTLGIKVGELDLLAGCPPCQGFSKMRTLNGSRIVMDPRNDLLFDFLKFIRIMRPRAIMMENVPGLADDDRFATFCEKLKNIGYVGESRVLNAGHYGVPQRRHRLIYLAGRGVNIPFAKPAKKRVTVEDAIRNLPKAGRSGDAIHDLKECRSPRIMRLFRRIPKDGGSRTDLSKRYQLACHKRCDGFKDVYGRMAWGELAPTITSGCFNPSKGRFLHPSEDRAITMREAALLQGFPRRYKFPVTDSKSAVALMIGNALPPPFIHRHAKCIPGILSKTHS